MTSFSPVASKEHRAATDSVATHCAVPTEESPVQLTVEILTGTDRTPAKLSLCWAGDISR